MKKKATALEKMLALYKTPSGIAKIMGYSRQRCTQWRDQGYIPYTQGNAVEKATGGKVTKLEVWESAAKARH